MAGCHHQRNGRELGQTSEDSKGREACGAAVYEVTTVGHDLRLNNNRMATAKIIFQIALMTQYLFVLVKPIDLTPSFGKIRMT